MADHVGYQMVAFGLPQDLPVQGAGLAEVVLLPVGLVGAPHDLPAHLGRGVTVLLRVNSRAAVAVGGVDRLVTGVVVTHGAVLVVPVDGHPGLVDRELLIVRADAVPAGVGRRCWEWTKSENFCGSPMKRWACCYRPSRSCRRRRRT